MSLLCSVCNSGHVVAESLYSYLPSSPQRKCKSRSGDLNDTVLHLSAISHISAQNDEYVATIKDNLSDSLTHRDVETEILEKVQSIQALKIKKQKLQEMIRRKGNY
jgi:hypothetical protein